MNLGPENRKKRRKQIISFVFILESYQNTLLLKILFDPIFFVPREKKRQKEAVSLFLK